MGTSEGGQEFLAQISGVIAALLCPLCISIGLVLWDKKWTGHAVALNVFKCSLASFMTVAILAPLFFHPDSPAASLRGEDEEATETLTLEGDSNPFTAFQAPSLWTLGDIVARDKAFWLGCMLSGLVGITIGDNTWLLAVQMIGSRRVIVVDSLKPFLAFFFGYFLVGDFSPPGGTLG
eukprot:Hpha_TRINITY_DN15585_c1_g13::TRINITY_DN15585_c1_g13_i1::g.103914::m.103914